MLTPEQFEMLLKTLNTDQGASASILVFTGILAMSGIVCVIWFILNMRLKPMDKLEEKLEELQKTLAEIASKMWSSEELDNRIDVKIGACIKDHERNCPLLKLRNADKE